MASFNPERAEVPLALPDGRTLKLVMDYQAVGALIAKHGAEWDTTVSSAMNGYDCPTVCEVVEILAARNHPEIKAADIMAASPAWLAVVDAINVAQRVFLFGTSKPPAADVQAASDEDEEGESEDGEERPFGNGHDGRKSSHRRWQRLLQRVYGRPSSGA